MTREEVIRGLEVCTNDDNEFCDGCPYQEAGYGCAHQLKRDALALLCEQEPVAPVLQSGGNYVCGNCGMYTVGFVHPLTGESVQTWQFCGSCGKKVRWE